MKLSWLLLPLAAVWVSFFVGNMVLDTHVSHWYDVPVIVSLIAINTVVLWQALRMMDAEVGK